MTHEPTCIVGAGLSGLIAAHAWPQLPVYDILPRPTAAHRALLRFRTDAVARLTGMEFRRVRVHKDIWMDGHFVRPSPLAANLYAQKCLGRAIGDRSIWNIDPVDRFIAPDNLHAQLLASVGQRVTWGVSFDWSASCISTAPLSVHAGVRLAHIDAATLFRAPINVERFRLPGWDVHQTVYFPATDDTGVYRASITGDTLIVESTHAHIVDADLDAVAAAFGLVIAPSMRIEGTTRQHYGKIIELPAPARKRALFELTHRHGIYSLGRFATWRNILLDDVVDDIAVIRRLINTSSAYDLRLEAS